MSTPGMPRERLLSLREAIIRVGHRHGPIATTDALVALVGRRKVDVVRALHDLEAEGLMVRTARGWVCKAALKPSGLQVSYRKAVREMARYLTSSTGMIPDLAQYTARCVMEQAMSEAQRAKLHAKEGS